MLEFLLIFLVAAKANGVSALKKANSIYSTDYHPSLAGAYLAACVFYASITGKTPVGLPDPPPELAEDLVDELQERAWDTYSQFKKKYEDCTENCPKFVTAQ